MSGLFARPSRAEDAVANVEQTATGAIMPVRRNKAALGRAGVAAP